MKFTIKAKLVLGFGIVVALTGATAFMGLRSLSTINDQAGAMVAGPVERLNQSQNIRLAIFDVVRSEKNMILVDDDAEIERYIVNSGRARVDVTQRITALRDSASPERRKNWESLLGHWQEFQAVHAKIEDLAKQNSNVRAYQISSTRAREGWSSAPSRSCCGWSARKKILSLNQTMPSLRH